MSQTTTLIIGMLICLGLNACGPKKADPESQSMPGTDFHPEVGLKDDPESQSMPGTDFRHDADLAVKAPDGTLKANYAVEIASTPDAITQGLMYRQRIDENRGMLFDPQGPANTGFWMKNTYIPLDIIFIDENLQIMNIAAGTTPFSEELIPPGGIYRYVLELNSGQTAKHNITIGDKIKWTKNI